MTYAGDQDQRRTSSVVDDLDQNAAGPSSSTDELPQRGTAQSLLARWRSIEQEAVIRNREDSTPSRRSASSSAAARRSQSTSRVEVRQRPRMARRGSDDDEVDVGNRLVG